MTAGFMSIFFYVGLLHFSYVVYTILQPQRKSGGEEDRFRNLRGILHTYQ